ncbi:HTH_Tnp_Tc3_2 domain-containing protein [Trichonephila clavipes]|nr:HTH_Tnp_Tc3_2 domain-containing protein [Trichonephila clavipes]
MDRLRSSIPYRTKGNDARFQWRVLGGKIEPPDWILGKGILIDGRGRQRDDDIVLVRISKDFQREGVSWRRCTAIGCTCRTRVTTPNEDKYLSVTAKRNRRSTTSDLSRQLFSATGTTVSRQTMYSRLGQFSLCVRRPMKCVALTATHCCLWLASSREHALCTPQQWSCVVFSDESRLILQSDSRRTFIWRAPVTLTIKKTPLNDTVSVVQDCWLGGGFQNDLHVQMRSKAG